MAKTNILVLTKTSSEDYTNRRHINVKITLTRQDQRISTPYQRAFSCTFDGRIIDVILFFDVISMDGKLTQPQHTCFEVFLKDKTL